MTSRSRTALRIECDESRLADLVDAITEKLQAGKPIDWAEYVAEYPEYAERLENWVAALKAVVDLGESFSPAGSPAPRAKLGSPDGLAFDPETIALWKRGCDLVVRSWNESSNCDPHGVRQVPPS